MSIQSQIDRIKGKVEDTYTQLKAKGIVDQSAEAKLDNLPSIIQNAEIGSTPTADSSVIAYVERSSNEIDNSTLTALGAYSAYQAPFTKVTFNNVTSIGERCFEDCSSLTEVNFPAVTTIGEYAFNNCSNLSNMSFDSLTVASTYNFSGTPITSINITSFPSLQKIENYAFSQCVNLTAIDHSGITELGDSAFNGFNRFGYLTIFNLPNLTTIGYSAFNNSDIRTVNFPNVTLVGESSFRYCSQLTEVNLPLATTMQSQAFQNCANIETLNLPELISIGEQCFDGCSKITTLSLPKLTTFLNSYSSIFSGMTSLRKVSLDSVVTTQNCNGVFSDSSFEEFNAPLLQYVCNSAFNNCKGLKQLYLPSLNYIESNAFNNCYSLQKIWIPSTTTVEANDSYYAPFQNNPYVQIYTDAESKPDTWGDYFNATGISDEVTVPVHYNQTITDYNNAKVTNITPYIDYMSSGYISINDGIVSNFSSNSMADLLNRGVFNPSNLTFVIKFTTPSETPTSEEYLYYNENWLRITLGGESSNMMQLSRYRLSDNVNLAIDTLELNTTYWLKMVINGGKCRFYISTNGTEYTFKVEDKDNYSWMNEDGLSTYMHFGNLGPHNSNEWKGSIDFNGCYIKQGDTVLWNGIVGETPIASTDTGWTAPVVEELDNDGLVAHWDFENTFKDGINNIEYNNYYGGQIASDESYRGNSSFKPNGTNTSSVEYLTDISSAGLNFNNDWSMSFKLHSDYFGKEGYDTSDYTSIFTLKTFNETMQTLADTVQFDFINGGYTSITFNGSILADLSTNTVKSLLHTGWNKFAVTYDASETRFSIYVNDTLVDSYTEVYKPNAVESSDDHSNICYMGIGADGYNRQQYFDDICLYNKVIYEYTGDTYQLDTNGLVAYWNFANNATTGKSKAEDSIANLHIGSGSMFTLVGNYNVGALYTSSNTHTVDLSSLSLSSANSFSIEYEIDTIGGYSSSSSRNPDIEFNSKMYLEDTSSNILFGTTVSKWGVNGGYIYTGSDGTLKTATAATDSWNKVTLTYNATTKDVKMYINDELIETINHSTDFTVGNMCLNLGYTQDDNWVPNYGIIDNLKIYNRDIKEQQS